MQQVFSSNGPSAGEEAAKPLIRFPLPLDVPRKRARSPATTTPETPALRLTAEERQALCRFIEYGNQPATASAVFARSVELQRGTPAQLLASSAAGQPSHSATAVKHRWCFTALYQARSLLCRFLARDGAAHYLRSTPASSSASPAAATDASASAAPAEESTPSLPSRVSTLELYCRVQALELELEDTTLLLESAARSDAVPEGVRQQLRADVDAVVRCIERSVDALEGTLVHMLLHDVEITEVHAASSTHLPSATPAAPPLEYVAKVLRELPAVLQSEQWPAQFLCDRSTATATAAESTPASATADASSLAHALSNNNSAASSPLATDVGGMTTSLALRSLFDLCHADVFNLLDVAAASPVSRLAALAKMSAARTAASPSAARPPVDAESIDFKTILVRAWNMGYAAVGLRRLAFEMDVLFYQYAMRSQQQKPKPGGSAACVRDVRELRTTWWRALEVRTSALLSKLGDTAEAASARREFGMFDTTVESCAVMRQRAVATAALADVQAVALRVLARLQAVDTKGWFAVPAFDLVNVDFTSVRYWIASPSFGHKSKREAYRSLCRVLERMVDCCVQKYGPTHAFSDVIATVRQKLVDVARAEGLL